MDTKALAQLLFPTTTKTIADLEKEFPQRDLAKGACVTRLAPSPTGFIHLGNLFGGFVDERLAHQSGGIMMLRIEDTDAKRKVENATDLIITSLKHFGIQFDEGAFANQEVGDYGPYYQSQRKEIYHVVAKYLVEIGRAYPSFHTEEELEALRMLQQKNNELPGYYGKFATDRLLTFAQIQEKLQADTPWVLRFKAMGNPEEVREMPDAIRKSVVIRPNNQDIVLLKTDGIPTYHFAHVVDDHFMRITHVVRGEEWLSTLPIHVELFETLNFELPTYCHTAHLMKMDGEIKRKLSKRLDPELSLEYYMQVGYFPKAVREYLMILMNSDFEEWRLANPTLPLEEFNFTLDKMSKSGALFDMDKLEDVSKEVLYQSSEEEILQFLIAWAKDYQKPYYHLITQQPKAMLQLLAIGRKDAKPRKDLISASQIYDLTKYYFDELYVLEDELPENVSQADALEIIERFSQTYDQSDDNSQWFDKIKEISTDLNYAVKMKEYRKNPQLFKGSVSDVANVIRLAMTGRLKTPDLYSIMQVMSKDTIMKRLKNLSENLK